MWPYLGLALVTYALYTAVRRLQLHNERKQFKAANGCQPPQSTMRNLFGLEFMFRAVRAFGKHRFLAWQSSLYKDRGRTFTIKFHLTNSMAVFTSDSENIKALLATKFDDWAVKKVRQDAVGALLGDGIFTTDGAFWSHSRAMLRPTFEKSQITDLEQFENHIGPLLARIPKDSSTVDLQPLFHQYTMDTSTELLTGASTNSLAGDNASPLQFVADFEYAMEDAGQRSRLGYLYYLWPRGRARKAIRGTHTFVNGYVEQALRVKRSLAGGGKKRREDGKVVFLDELAKHEEVDADRIRDETLNILLAGRDTTASLLAIMWFVLAREPEVWKKLQNEVDELNGELPSYDHLRNMKYLKYFTQESLRLYPPVPALAKMAVRDTVLPHGGGADGLQPLFCPEGTTAPYDVYSVHRNPDVYGADAEKCNPDRWADPNLRPGWNYLPFGGGPRVCLGQQYALTEAQYVTVRLMQNFRRIECRDPEPYMEKLTATCCSFNGTKIALYEE